jgi:hypothetical protein
MNNSLLFMADGWHAGLAERKSCQLVSTFVST